MTEGAAHVRGSTLLLVDRFVLIGITLVSQALIARHLTQTEFGAFALAIGIAGVGQVFITLGLHRGATHTFARDQEAQDHPRLVGSILVNIGIVVGLGLTLFLGIAVAQGLLTANGLLDPTATGVLLILVLLAPIDALDDMLIALYAVGGSRHIFIRRYIVGPLLKLLVAGAWSCRRATPRSSPSATSGRPCSARRVRRPLRAHARRAWRPADPADDAAPRTGPRDRQVLAAAAHQRRGVAAHQHAPARWC